MADRCALLKSMKQKVIERGIVQKKYTDGERCCVVGYGLSELGMTSSELIALRGASIINVYEHTRTTSYGVPCAVWNNAHALVRQSGIFQEEWVALQDANDWKDQQVVMMLLDEMLVASDC